MDDADLVEKHSDMLSRFQEELSQSEKVNSARLFEIGFTPHPTLDIQKEDKENGNKLVFANYSTIRKCDAVQIYRHHDDSGSMYKAIVGSDGRTEMNYQFGKAIDVFTAIGKHIVPDGVGDGLEHLGRLSMEDAFRNLETALSSLVQSAVKECDEIFKAGSATYTSHFCKEIHYGGNDPIKVYVELSDIVDKVKTQIIDNFSAR